MITHFQKKRWLRAGLIIVITLVAYIPAMRADFIWDDDTFLTENPLIKADDGLYRFWFTTQSPDYYPLTSSSLWLEWRLWGMNATGYHVVNVILHALISVLIWLVLERLKIPGAWLIGLIFAVHPVNVQSVAWITERKNTLSMLFYLLTILSYLKFEKNEGRIWYPMSLGLFLFALLSKTSVVMLPFVLLGCAWWQRSRITGRDIVNSIPFFFLSGVLSLVTIWFQYNRAIGEAVVRSDGFFSRLAGAGWAVWFYLFKTIFPFNLSFVYPQWNIDVSSVLSYLPGLSLVGIMVLFWWYRRSWGKVFLFGFGYYMVTLFPVLGFFDIYFMKFSLVADHWQYISITGIIAIMVALGIHILAGWRREVRQLAAVALISLFFLLTWGQGGIYQDVKTLWRDTITKNPACWMAHNNIGIALADEGNLDEAVAHYNKALQISPRFSEAHDNLGNALARQGKGKEALYHYNEALRLEPDNPEAHNNLGIALAGQGKVEEAITHYNEALRINPCHVKAHTNLGLALAEQGKLEEAIVQYGKALRLKGDSPSTLNNLAWILATEENPEFRNAREAVNLAEKACEITGYKRFEFLDTLAAAYAEAGRFQKAIDTAKIAMRLALSAGQKNIADVIKERLDLYASGRPFHVRSK